MNKLKEAKKKGDPCWVGYKQYGMKDKDGRKVPNCVKEVVDIYWETQDESCGYTFEFEKQPMTKLVTEKNLMTFKHEGFWKCMDTLRDKIILDKMWNEKKHYGKNKKFL